MKQTSAWLAILLVLPIAAFANGNDRTPAHEGVCDELKSASPGLFGLCIAYCEAMDCENDQVDSTSCTKTLTNYRRKMDGIDDPPMPCIASPECPCFTQTLVDDISQRIPIADSSWCINWPFADGDYRYISVLIGEPPDDPFEEWDAIAGISDYSNQVWCNYRDYNWNGETSSEVLVDWMSPITSESVKTYQACVDTLEIVWESYDLPRNQGSPCQ